MGPDLSGTCGQRQLVSPSLGLVVQGLDFWAGAGGWCHFPVASPCAQWRWWSSVSREFFKTQILRPHCRLRRCRLRSASSTTRARSWVHTQETEAPGSERVSWPSYQGPDFRSGYFLGASNPILHFLLCWSQNAFFGWYFLIFPSTLREKAMATHFSVLAWGNPRDWGAW